MPTTAPSARSLPFACPARSERGYSSGVADSRDIDAAASLAERLTRVAIAADLAGAGFRQLLAMLAALGDDLPELYAAVDDGFARFAVQAPLPPRAGDRARLFELHRARFAAQHARLAGLRERPARVMLLELEARGNDPIEPAFIAVGPAPLAEDVDRVLAWAGCGDAARAALDAAARALTDRGRCDALADRALAGGPRWELRFILRGPDTAARLADAAAAVGVGAAQVTFVRGAHVELAGDAPVVASIVITAGGVASALGLEYPAPTWELALRLLSGLHAESDPGRRLGAFAGAVGVDRPAMVRISLGGPGMPGVQVWARLGTRRQVTDIAG